MQPFRANNSNSGQFTFVHKSFHEHFVAVEITSKMMTKHRTLTPTVVRALREVPKNHLGVIEQCVAWTLKHSNNFEGLRNVLREDSESLCSSFLCSVLVQSDPMALVSMNLANRDLSQANLSGGMMCSVDFSNSNLKDTVVTCTHFVGGTKLKGTDMTGCVSGVLKKVLLNSIDMVYVQRSATTQEPSLVILNDEGKLLGVPWATTVTKETFEKWIFQLTDIQAFDYTDITCVISFNGNIICGRSDLTSRGGRNTLFLKDSSSSTKPPFCTQAPVGSVTCIRSDRAGNVLLALGHDGTCSEWNVSSPSSKDWTNHKLASSRLNDCVFSEDGTYVFFATDTQTSEGSDDVDGSMALFRRRYPFHLEDDNEPFITTDGTHTGNVNAIRYLHDKKRIISVSSDSTARVWNESSLSCVSVLVGESPMLCVEITEALILIGCEDFSIRIFSGDDTILTGTILDHNGPVVGITFSPDGTFFLSRTPTAIHYLEFSAVEAMRFSQDRQTVLREGYSDARVSCATLVGSILVVGTFNGSILAFPLNSSDGVVKFERSPHQGNGKVTSVSCNANGSLVCSTENGGRCLLWRKPDIEGSCWKVVHCFESVKDVESAQILHEFHHKSVVMRPQEFEEQSFVWIVAGPSVHIYSVVYSSTHGDEVREDVLKVAHRSTSPVIPYGVRGGMAIKLGPKLLMIVEHPAESNYETPENIAAFACSVDGSHLYVSHTSGDVFHVTKRNGFVPLHGLTNQQQQQGGGGGGGGVIQCITVSNNTKWVALANGNVIYVLSVSTDDLVFVLHGFAEQVDSINFSIDNTSVVVCGNYGECVLWDLRSDTTNQMNKNPTRVIYSSIAPCMVDSTCELELNSFALKDGVKRRPRVENMVVDPTTTQKGDHHHPYPYHPAFWTYIVGAVTGLLFFPFVHFVYWVWKDKSRDFGPYSFARGARGVNLQSIQKKFAGLGWVSLLTFLISYYYSDVPSILCYCGESLCVFGVLFGIMGQRTLLFYK
eukprot:PhF_6_TR7838/c1_g1_i1/m.11384